MKPLPLTKDGTIQASKELWMLLTKTHQQYKNSYKREKALPPPPQK